MKINEVARVTLIGFIALCSFTAWSSETTVSQTSTTDTESSKTSTNKSSSLPSSPFKATVEVPGNVSVPPIVINLIQSANSTSTSTVNETPKPRNTGSRGQLVKIPPIPSLDLVIDKRARNSPKIRKLYRLLGIRNSPKVIHFVTEHRLADANRDDNIFLINTRSFLDSLVYLSHAVEVPSELYKKGIVMAPKYPNGQYFNINQLTRGLLSIHMSNRRPTSNVNVAVYYRNHWYYINDNDISAKRTFRLAQQLFNLQAGEVQSQTPVLTIPVGPR